MASVKSSIEPGTLLKITHRTYDQLLLESGFSSFSEGVSYELKDFKYSILKAGCVGIVFLIGGLASIAEIIKDAWEEDPTEAQLLIAAIILMLLMSILMSATSYMFFQSWEFETSTEKLIWTGKFLLGIRKKQYRLSRFSGVAILDPKKDFYSNYSLALVRQQKSIFQSCKPLKLMRIGSGETPHLQQRIYIHKELAEESSEFMGWPSA